MMIPDRDSKQKEIKATAIVFPGQRISWAGEGITDGSFLFGSENGFIFESGIDGPLANAQSFRAVIEAESINGIAYGFRGEDLYLGVSTRAEVVIHRFIKQPPSKRSFRFEFGSHGISGLCNKGFITPSGPSGLVTFILDSNGEGLVGELPSINGRPYFYEIASLTQSGLDGYEVFAAACRTDGLVIVGIKPSGEPTFLKGAKISSKAIDFVGLCSIGDELNPLALVGLGKDKSVHFIRDPMHSPHIDSLTLPFVPGVAYRVLCIRGHLLLLTSIGLCVIRDVATQYLKGGDIGGYRTIRFMEIEAVDFCIAFGRWLLIVTMEGVIRIDVNEILPPVESPIVPDAIKRRMNVSFPPPSISESDLVAMVQPVWQEVQLRSGLMQTASR